MTRIFYPILTHGILEHCFRHFLSFGINKCIFLLKLFSEEWIFGKTLVYWLLQNWLDHVLMISRNSKQTQNNCALLRDNLLLTRSDLFSDRYFVLHHFGHVSKYFQGKYPNTPSSQDLSKDLYLNLERYLLQYIVSILKWKKWFCRKNMTWCMN